MNDMSQQTAAQPSGTAIFVMVAMVGMLVITLFMTGLAIVMSSELLDALTELSQCRTSLLLGRH